MPKTFVMLKITLRCNLTARPLAGAPVLLTRPGLFGGWSPPARTDAAGVTILAALTGPGTLFVAGQPVYEGIIPQDAVFFLSAAAGEYEPAEAQEGAGAQVPVRLEEPRALPPVQDWAERA